MARLAAEDSLCHFTTDVLGSEQGVLDLLQASLNPSGDERSLHPVGVHSRGLDEGSIVAVLQLLRQALVESHGASLCAAIVDHASDSCVGGHGGCRDDVALLAADHARQELAHSVPMRDEVDVEDLLQVGIGHVDDVVCLTNAGIVDEDGGGTEVLLDARCNIMYSLGFGNVAFVVRDVGDCGLVSRSFPRPCCLVEPYTVPERVQGGPGPERQSSCQWEQAS